MPNGTESDVDCGGADCTACPPDKACKGPTDCESEVCQLDKCVNNLVWAKAFGPGDVTTMAWGNDAIYMAGHFTGVLAFDGG